jgi:hypothetical protein
MTFSLHRRNFLSGLFCAAGGLVVAGCSPSQKSDADLSASDLSSTRSAKPQPVSMTVYRDPSCGCCEAWAKQAQSHGFSVLVVDRPDMPAIKRKHGVPEDLASCHTAMVAGYAIEGHVPFADVRRLLAEEPSGIRGLAVPGMPRGSPGMEVPDGAKDPFQVMAFDADGKVSVFTDQQT